MKLSILMPVYNEARTVELAVKETLAVEFPCETELVLVDDGSADGTSEVVDRLASPRVRVLHHERNQGKGAAVRTAAQAASGDYVVVMDADLEYRASDLPRLLQPVIDGTATVVYGTRTFGSHTAYSFWYVVGNKGITLAANMLYNCYLSDVYTCFKLMPTALFRDLDLRRSGFDAEIEATAKLLRRGERPYEVPVSYRARRREEGKKITWQDGVRALWTLASLRFSRDE